jgi:hypothetical protein
MVMNLVALASIAGAIVAGILLFRRHLSRGAAVTGGGENVCLRCGTPAAALASFTCPGCGHDVREAGVGPRLGRTAAGAFWPLVYFTFAYVVLALIVSGVLLNVLPRVYVVTRNTTMTVSSPEIRGVELFLDGRGRDEAHFAGTLTGDLYGSRGVVTLDVDVPARRWRLLDASGTQLDAGDRLDGEVIYRWIEAAGAPTDTPVAHSDAAHIARAVGQLAGAELEMPPVPGTGRALGLSYSASSGGGSSNTPDKRWTPLMVIAAAGVWLAGVYLILLAHRRPNRPAPVAEAAPSSEVSA